MLMKWFTLCKQVHSMCYKSVNPECNYGILAPILLPPHAVSTTRHTVALETLIGSQPRRRETASRTSFVNFIFVHKFYH